MFDALGVDPDPSVPSSSSSGSGAPLRLMIRAGSAQRVFVWKPTARYYGRWRDDTKRFDQWLQLVRRMVGSLPEYQALPPARGIYTD